MALENHAISCAMQFIFVNRGRDDLSLVQASWRACNTQDEPEQYQRPCNQKCVLPVTLMMYRQLHTYQQLAVATCQLDCQVSCILTKLYDIHVSKVCVKVICQHAQ